MHTNFRNSHTSSEFLEYLASLPQSGDERIPPLNKLSQMLGISVSLLREQMEVARSFGLVEVKPKTGIRRLPYRFEPAVLESLNYALNLSPEYLQHYSDLRSHIESAYFVQAISLLDSADHTYLRSLIESALNKLHCANPQIPHKEHRELHTYIYRHLNNPFVTGLLEVYWDVYEEEGLSFYFDYKYLENVWMYHEKMVDAIIAGNYDKAYKVLIDHMALIGQRTPESPRQAFE